jgi:hypothetical protein
MPEIACPPGEICRPTFWNVPFFLEIVVYLGGLIAAIIFKFSAKARASLIGIRSPND